MLVIEMSWGHGLMGVYAGCTVCPGIIHNMNSRRSVAWSVACSDMTGMAKIKILRVNYVGSWSE